MFGVATEPTRKPVGETEPVKSFTTDQVPRVKVAVTTPVPRSPSTA